MINIPDRPLLYVDKQNFINYTYNGKIKSYFDVAPLTEAAPKGAKGRENSKKVVVLYKTNWCGYCTQMKPIFDKVANDCKGKGINFVTIDCDEIPHPEIRSYPTIILTDEMGKSHRYNRAYDYQQLLSFVLSPVY
jgi:thiol-disulfide isomerase/thioredoxin